MKGDILQGGEYEGGFLAGEQEGQGAMSVPQEDEQEEELWEQFQVLEMDRQKPVVI